MSSYGGENNASVYGCYTKSFVNNTSIYGNYTEVFGNNTSNEQYENSSDSMIYIFKIDSEFEPNKTIELCIFCFFLFYYTPALILYIINRKHVLIRYLQPRSIIIGALLSVSSSLLIPIFRMAKIPCIINTWVIGSLIYSFFVVTFSRYIRIFYIQKLNIFKFEFSKRQKKLFEKDERITGEVIRSNNVENDTLISINNNSTNTSSNALSGDHNFAVPVDFSIANPMNYYKGLERTIKKRITIYFVFFPILLLLTYYFVVSIRYWDKMKKACPNEPKEISSPKFVTSLVIYILSIFLIYQAFVKQKWDIKFKIEYITFLIVQICAAIFVQFIVGQKLGDEIIKYRVYFFHLYPITVHLLCVIEPLIKIFISKYTKKEEMSNVEEFLNQLSNTNFKEHVTDIAIRTFCIENLLFIEAHTDLINAVISYYKKKNPNIVESLTYCSSNVLHKSKINPILYQSFDPVFKPYYDRIYNTFIKEGGIASVNIKSITVHTIDINMENNEYSYLMFFNAIEEVSELLFINVNQKLYLNQ